MGVLAAETAYWREAVGVFSNTISLHRAVRDLASDEFDAGQLGLLAGAHAVERLLDGVYQPTGESSRADGHAPVRAFVETEMPRDPSWNGFGDLYDYGADSGAGAVVATTGVLGGVLMQAGADPMAWRGPLRGLVMHDADAAYLEREIGAGRLLLFVRTLDAELQSRAVEILLRYSIGYPRVYSIVCAAAAADGTRTGPAPKTARSIQRPMSAEPWAFAWR